MWLRLLQVSSVNNSDAEAWEVLLWSAVQARRRINEWYHDDAIIQVYKFMESDCVSLFYVTWINLACIYLQKLNPKKVYYKDKDGIFEEEANLM